jgi:hypothetical protein
MDTPREAVESLRMAMVNADHAMLERLTADELSYGHTSGLIEDKSSFIDAIAGSTVRDVFKRIELSDEVVTVLGDVALVRHRFKAEVLVNGASMNPDIRVLQIWQQKQDGWKLLARQAYKV